MEDMLGDTRREPGRPCAIVASTRSQSTRLGSQYPQAPGGPEAGVLPHGGGQDVVQWKLRFSS